MSQQLLETEGIIAQDEVANGKGMAKNVGTDTLVGDPCPFAKTGEELRHTVSRQWQTGLREKEVIFASTAPNAEFFLLRPMSIDVIKQMT
jgi:hypothetical protein